MVWLRFCGQRQPAADRQQPAGCPHLGDRRAGRGTAPAGCGDCLVLAGHWRPVEALDHKDRGSPSV